MLSTLAMHTSLPRPSLTAAPCSRGYVVYWCSDVMAMQSGISHLLVIVQIQVKVIGREVAHLNLVGAHKAAEVGFACEVAFTRHAAEIQV